MQGMNQFLFIIFLLFCSQIYSQPFREDPQIRIKNVRYSYTDWGDYDNDGNLDLLLSGSALPEMVTEVYCNPEGVAASFYAPNSINLLGLSSPIVKWIDLDNDNDLDILISGHMAGGVRVTKLYRNQGYNVFEEISGTNLPAVSPRGIDFGDYNNDGNTDILLSGSSDSDHLTKLYKNVGNCSFEEVSDSAISNLVLGLVAWGDYDADGDLDILFSGSINNDDYVIRILKQLDDGSFEPLTGFYLNNIKGTGMEWGDYDNDGDLDFLISGVDQYGDMYTEVYKNVGNDTFQKLILNNIQNFHGKLSWGDYDNDGNLDFVITGINYADIEVFKLYKNIGNDSFEEDPYSIYHALNKGSINWGDYNNDNRLDFVITGRKRFYVEYRSYLYKNTAETPNTRPNAPANLGFNELDGAVNLTWDKATDNETAQDGLSYNIYISTEKNACNIISPMANLATGVRKIAKQGLIKRNSHIIKNLPDGKYYWSVQAIDCSLCGSEFAPIDSFLVGGPQTTTVNFDLNNGWNMVSTPLTTDDMTVQSVFSDATSNAFVFNNGYQTADELEVGIGYWVKFDAAVTQSVTGYEENIAIPVSTGWNMIGGLQNTLSVAELTTEPSGIIESNFFGFDNAYVTATEIKPGYGYWVKASEDGVINTNKMVAKQSKPTEEMDALYTISMMVSDNGTGSYALGLGLDPNATEGIDSDLGETELPPMPPTGVFDARLMLPDGTTSSPMDYRTGDAGYSGTVEYDLSWQYSSGADALTLDIVIPEVPGTVEMTIVDGFGGAVFSQVVEEGTTQVVVDNANLSALNLNIAYTAPIPVELTGFAANVAGEAINLEWSTATETNNKGFEVERSEDGENFSKIAFVDGMGTTTEAQSYIFTDRNAVGGTYYYRLRQVDFDGTYAYSDVVEVEFVPSEYSLQQNYPNPFNPSTTIKFALPVEAKVTVTLYNALGQRVNEIVSNNFTAGVQTVNFNASELASGMYIYQISAQGVDGSNFVDTKKMMLMK